MKVLLASFEPRRDRTPASWRFVRKPTRHASSRQFESQPTETEDATSTRSTPAQILHQADLCGGRGWARSGPSPPPSIDGNRGVTNPAGHREPCDRLRPARSWRLRVESAYEDWALAAFADRQTASWSSDTGNCMRASRTSISTYSTVPKCSARWRPLYASVVGCGLTADGVGHRRPDQTDRPMSYGPIAGRQRPQSVTGVERVVN